MSQLTLVIGDKNFSSWSMRPWMVLKQAGIPFREVNVMLDNPETKAEILRYSPAGKVPALIDGETRVWESLAICEYLNDKFLEKNLWPKDPQARAGARSISNEMHAGFPSIRENLSMDMTASLPGRCRYAAASEIARIEQIWTQCRETFLTEGPFLFGAFSIADAMYAPVVSRFRTYHVSIKSPLAKAYMDHIAGLPSYNEWLAGAKTQMKERFGVEAVRRSD